MSVHIIAADEALMRLDAYSAVLDVRSPGEYALDCLPGAGNWPVLDDAERERVGTLYVQAGAFEAKRLGAVLVARNIARHMESHARDWPKSHEPLVYCWRGGNRSAAMAHVLGQVGWRVHLVQGGYKALRAALVKQLERQVGSLRLRVVCGPTGSGKSRLLQALARQGAQVLDLEQLAAHRGSVLGAMEDEPQPTQKQFETRIWNTLRQFDPSQTVFVESESRKIGRLQLPVTLLACMHASACMRLQASLPVRVQLLLQDYAALTRTPQELNLRLDALTELRGKVTIARWHSLVDAGAFATLVEELLAQHYDPSYAQSMARNYAGFGSCRAWPVESPDAGAFDTLAREILQAAC